MTKTIMCTDCGWTTDIETTSDTNPHVCPKCKGAIVDAGTGEPVVATVDASCYSILDSDTAETVDTSHLTGEQIASIISESLAAGGEGHVRPECLDGRRVYALED